MPVEFDISILHPTLQTAYFTHALSCLNIRYCKQHSALYEHRCAYWVDNPPCGKTRQHDRFTCSAHRDDEDEFNRRNEEATWTAAQRARILMSEVGKRTTSYEKYMAFPARWCNISTAVSVLGYAQP